jgi:hypothetical protein
MSWTEQELVDFLNRKNISADSYSLYGDKSDAFCIDKIGDEWLVYYSERGSKNELAWAKNEAQAFNLLKLFLLEAHKAL